MPFRDLIEQVLSKNLCASCGVCTVVCPNELIRMNELLPELSHQASEEQCGTCLDCVNVCPGLSPGTPESEDVVFGRRRTTDERWLGIFNAVLGAHSTEEEIFSRSGSGGGATGLLKAAMEYLNLDCVVVAGRETERPWRAAPVVCSDSRELVNYSQSTYQLFPHLGVLKKLFRENPSYRVGIVGLACHMQAIRKLQRMEGEWGDMARRQILFTVEIACSSNTTPAGTETMITQISRTPLEDVADIRFRTGEYPGQVVITTRSGDKRNVPFWQLVKHFKDYKTHRCLSCGDWMSGLADVSVCDGDPNIFKSSLEITSAYEKHATLLVRTETGAKVVEWATENNVLKTWPSTIEGMNLGMERKRNRRGTYERRNVPIPEGPIPGYMEEFEITPDEVFLATPNVGEGKSS